MTLCVHSPTVTRLLSGLGKSERDLWHQVIVAITIGAAAVFALISGIPSQMLGRKVTILAASAIFAAGSVVMGVATNKELLLVGRFIVGAAVGECCNTDETKIQIANKPQWYSIFHSDSLSPKDFDISYGLVNVIFSGLASTVVPVYISEAAPVSDAQHQHVMC